MEQDLGGDTKKDYLSRIKEIEQAAGAAVNRLIDYYA